MSLIGWAQTWDQELDVNDKHDSQSSISPEQLEGLPDTHLTQPQVIYPADKSRWWVYTHYLKQMAIQAPLTPERIEGMDE